MINMTVNELIGKLQEMVELKLGDANVRYASNGHDIRIDEVEVKTSDDDKPYIQLW